jgi:hypothetical protein
MKREKFKELVGMSIGRASMCWSEAPKGVFDSTTASQLVDRILEAAYPSQRMKELETLVRGHMDAMRPLLDEWSVLNEKSNSKAGSDALEESER